jgi:hypothetical protein
MEEHPAILKFFVYDHLPAHLQPPSKLFATLALELVENVPPNAEREVALRKLLEAKDAAVRSLLGAPTSFEWSRPIGE